MIRPRRGIRLLASVASILVGLVAVPSAAATSPSESPAVPPDAGAVFESRKSELLAEGVRVADGFVFSCVRLPLSRSATERAREVAQGKAGARAIRQMLEWQVGERALVGVPAGPLRQALSEAAVACIGGRPHVQRFPRLLID